MTATIAIQHYAFKEGRAAANNGYTGPVPSYVNSRDAGQWVEGYTSEIKARLALGLPALGSAAE